MRSFAKFSPAFWTGDLGRSLRGDHLAQAVAVYLVTGPSCNSIGLYWLPIGHLAHDLGSPFEEASKALRRVSEGGFCTYDERNEIVWVHLHARHQHGERMKPADNNIPAIRSLALECSKSFLCLMFWEMYGEVYHLGDPPGPSPFEAPSKPLRRGSRARDRDRDRDGEGDREGYREGDARGGDERPPPAAPPEVVEGKKPKGAPRTPKARKAFPFSPLPLELAALPWFRERWEYRINALPSKDRPTPAGEIEQLQEALLLYRTHGEEALRKGVTKAINRGWTGFEMGWCLERNGAGTNGYDRDAIRQEHKQAGNSPATQARLAAAIIERERAKREYEESFLTEGPRNDDD